MRYVLIILAGIMILPSCGNKQGNAGKRELLPEPEKYVHDGYRELADSLKPQFLPDTAIGQVSLLNSANVDAWLGADVMKRLSDDDFPNSSVISSDENQRLTVYFYPGGARKEFAVFSVSHVRVKSRSDVLIDEDEFVTESGVKLGMTMEAFKALKGEPDSTSNGETITFYYRIDHDRNADFMSRYNMPVYSAEYVFINGYLSDFKFGFEYP